ncbi:mannitol dehydrogenase family protein [Halomonas sp. McH1-25]|uniref:mannitol dehydrogenase family protein n=1 Tax=unclassified Halomonas TaxID=2609666 RepID=UPI001EF5284F|nr:MULTISPECIES: mannitol dehydrogenase family protein [unclassified Halomonas]MCG7598787.1 mannitol dehydrogenase family protein [Halomonas sp. McH1-25]MCP1340750.1 mannitol dehydrogenase family protein [Halomonas sp. FL8]MCP1359521.1 mannitol dehydrogenase family protein [Halomonas sp. BBD45]MCP1365873.1 mannitol dehydrogenase family protein [Halomonas sp. BBD48]
MALDTVPSNYGQVDIGIVHLGLGAFHRAHQAVYLERHLARHGGSGGWGICSANIRSNWRLVEQLRAQGQRYHVAEYADREHVTLREIAAIRETLYAGEDGPDREALLVRMSDPKVRIVTLTVTEKGYYLNPAEGTLMTDDPAIAHDLDNPDSPCTAPGMLVEALARRHRAGIPPFTVLSCDNMPDNGKRTRQAVIDLACQRDAVLAEWIAANVAFPSSMVDRIVPAMTEQDFARLAELGIDDTAAVVCEAFSQWVVEDDFPQGRPDWEHDGVEMVSDVAPFEAMKLRMLNGSHSLLAYLGALDGVETVADAVSRPDIAALLTRYMQDEAIPTLSMPAGTDLTDYTERLLARFGNDSLRHRTHQIAMDGSQKLPQRWLNGAQSRLAAGGGIACTALGVAAWIRYTRGGDLHGQPHTVDDPMAETFAELHRRHAGSDDALVAAFLGLESIFPSTLASDERFTRPVLAAYRSLEARGVAATLDNLDSLAL